jgi:hypothetical protein
VDEIQPKVRALIAIANVATALGSISASSDMVDSEGAANEAVLNSVHKISNFWHFKRKKRHRVYYESTLLRKYKTLCSFLEKKSILNINEII